MNILVLGGTYFIGKILVQMLLSIGHTVSVLNRGTRLLDAINVSLIKADRQKPGEIQNGLTGKRFDVVIDLSGYKESDVAVVVDALDGRFGQYIFCSSVAVCSQPPIHWPITEGHKKCSSVMENEYGYNKWLAEQYLFQYGKRNSVSISAVRPVYVYGPYDYSVRLDYFFERISSSNPVIIAGNGENIIQFGYVYDLCKAIASIINNTTACGEAFNISGNELVSVNQLVNLISTVIGKNVKIFHASDIDGASSLTTSHRFADVRKARDMLRIIPETSLFDGLTRTYQWWLSKGGSK